MSDESEWKDVNPITADLPNKGRTVILFIAGGLALGILGFIGMKIRPVGLAAGMFAFITGISMLIRSQKYKQQQYNQKYNWKMALILTAAGFLMLLANPRFGIVAGFAGYFLITGAIALVVVGLSKAIKLAWDVGNRS